MKKRMIPATLMICAIILLMIGVVACAQAASVTTWAELQNTINSASTDSQNPTEITLTQSLTAGARDKDLELTGKAVILDLNGYTLDRGLSQAAADYSGNVITLMKHSFLTIKDNAGGGKITGGNAIDDGGGIFVLDSTLIMEGGYISNNKTNNNGGGVYLFDSTFEMRGGAITQNEAGGYGGGGVFIDDNSGFTMSGGSIAHNSAARGGGVCTDDYATLTLTGGSIMQNNHGGVYAYFGCTFTVSGKPVIKDNTDGSVIRNITLFEGNRIWPNPIYINVNGALSDGAVLPVYRGVGATVAVGKSYTLTAADAAKFSSDVDPTIVGGLVENTVQMKKPLSAEMVTMASDTAEYTGEVFSPITLTDGDTMLVAGVNYTISYSVGGKVQTDIKDAGVYDVTITGIGCYLDSVETQFTVTQKPVTVTGLTVSDKVYDGKTEAVFTGAPVLTGAIEGDEVVLREEKPSAAFEDKAVGKKKKVIFSGYSLDGGSAGNYSLSEPTATATITAKPVAISGVTTVGRAYEPDNLTVGLTGGTLSGVIDGDKVAVDLTIAKGTMADANTGENKAVTVTGVALSGKDAGNYALEAQPAGLTVTITRAANPMTVAPTAGVKVDGNSVDLSANVSKAVGIVTYAITGGLEGCSIDANTGMLTSGAVTGTCIVTVTAAGDGNHEAGTAVITVSVTEKDIQTLNFAEAAVTKNLGDAPFINPLIGAATNVTYAVTAGAEVASVAPDGTVTILAIGTATITATAEETEIYFSASASYTLTVVRVIPPKTDIGKAKISAEDQEYTGKEIKPKLTVKLNGKKLKEKKDYTAAFKFNKDIGKATVTITGTGDYTGTATGSFLIIPKKVGSPKLTAEKGKKDALTLSWKAGKGIDGYEIEYGLKKDFKGAKKIKIKGAKNDEYEIKKLTAKKTYYVRIRAWKKAKGKMYYSAWSKTLSKKVK